jgi:pentatricopeptide repeat protein
MELFNTMKSEYSVVPDAIVYNTIISVLVNNRQYNHAFGIYYKSLLVEKEKERKKK